MGELLARTRKPLLASSSLRPLHSRRGALKGRCARMAQLYVTSATVLSVADRRPVELTSTWQGNQKVVVEFLRHFG